MIHTVEGFDIVNKAEKDVFLELSCFFHGPADVGNLISGSSAFSKTRLNIWKFTVHILLKPGLRILSIMLFQIADFYGPNTFLLYGATVSQKEAVATCRMMTETARKNSLDDEERKAVKPMTVKWLESKELLFRRNGKLVPTYAYYIVAGHVPPGMVEPRIRCGAFKGKVKGDFYDRRECEGPIADQIEDAYQFVLKNMRVGTTLPI